jgi:hypothetical protein
MPFSEAAEAHPSYPPSGVPPACSDRIQFPDLVNSAPQQRSLSGERSGTFVLYCFR